MMRLPEYSCTVLGLPAPQGSKRGFVVKGRAVLVESSKAVRPWREAVKAAAFLARDGGEPLQGPVTVSVSFYMPRPNYHYGTGRNAGVLKESAPRWVSVKPDLDKLIRSTCDALTDAGVYQDDSRIVSVHAQMQYVTRESHGLDVPGAKICVSEIGVIE